ncbi:hypothetical protein [Glaesserella sp.]|uniref:hypothetical protein n=1 Tax=Glaesserella sp. TaxID=2094731 RepID=UPI00359FE34D
MKITADELIPNSLMKTIKIGSIITNHPIKPNNNFFSSGFLYLMALLQLGQNLSFPKPFNKPVFMGWLQCGQGIEKFINNSLYN